MNTRRNFLGNMLLAGAGFFILPPALSGKRIWVPERQIVSETVASIWETHWLDHSFVVNAWPPMKIGEVRKCGHNLFYGGPNGAIILRKHRRPIPWMKDPSRTITSKECEAQMNSIISGEKSSYSEDVPYITVALEEAIAQSDAAVKAGEVVNMMERQIKWCEAWDAMPKI